MGETQEKETKQSAQEEGVKQPVREESVVLTEHKPSRLRTVLGRRRFLYVAPYGYELSGGPYFLGKFPLVVLSDAYQVGSDIEASGAEEVEQQEIEAECLRLSEYINDNILDIIKLREVNDRLSEELRMAMAKLKAA